MLFNRLPPLLEDILTVMALLELLEIFAFQFGTLVTTSLHRLPLPPNATIEARHEPRTDFLATLGSVRGLILVLIGMQPRVKIYAVGVMIVAPAPTTILGKGPNGRISQVITDWLWISVILLKYPFDSRQWIETPLSVQSGTSGSKYRIDR